MRLHTPALLLCGYIIAATAVFAGNAAAQESGPADIVSFDKAQFVQVSAHR
jgi:hypothetical protein